MVLLPPQASNLSAALAAAEGGGGGHEPLGELLFWSFDVHLVALITEEWLKYRYMMSGRHIGGCI
jgi:hypothetical protein